MLSERLVIPLSLRSIVILIAVVGATVAILDVSEGVSGNTAPQVDSLDFSSVVTNRTELRS